LLEVIGYISDDSTEDDLLGMLSNEYSERCDLSEEEFREHLFGGEVAEPSGFFISNFIRYALERLEAIAEQAEKPAAA